MTHKEKIAGAITSAMNHVEDSVKALTNQNENAVVNLVWHASAETEYALFHLSLMRREESGSSPLRHSLSAKQMEVEPALDSAQNLLREARDNIEAGNFEEAYEKTWTARGYLLRVQDTLEKKLKSSLKPATQTP